MLLLLTEWLCLHSCNIAFPEIAAPVVAELNRAAKQTKVRTGGRAKRNRMC